jgi:hypothetical protein
VSSKRADPASPQNPPAVPAAAKQEKTSAKPTPYHRAARAYVEAGWSPIRLPHRKKFPPPAGYTGYFGTHVGLAEAEAFARAGGGNVGLRLPPNVLAIDVDNYGEKTGGVTFDDAARRLGPLPPTWRSTARHDDPVSGIYYFRVPAGRVWPGELGPDVELIHHGERYAVVAPSVHPNGGEYGWYDPDGLPAADGPTVGELPELPAEWVAELDRGDAADRPAKVSLKEGDAWDWLQGLPTGDPCPPVQKVLDGAEKAFSDGSRHDTARGLVLRLVRLGEQGHTGTLAALDTLEGMFLAAFGGDGDREPDWGEWERLVSGAVGTALTQPTPDADKGCCAPVDEDGEKVSLTVRLRDYLSEKFHVFPAGDQDGLVYVQRKGGGRAEQLSANVVIRGADGLGNRQANLYTAANDAAKVLGALAYNEAPRDLALRVHYRPGRIVLDLAQRNSRCVVVTPSGWTLQDAPPSDVVFAGAPGAALPDPVPGGSVDELRRLLRWQPDDRRWLLVKGWLPCTLLADLPRPGLWLLGPQGSAKSTTGRFLTSLIDPKPAGVLGGNFGKNLQDDETKALGSYMPSWDNVSHLSNDGSDYLARLMTGEYTQRRRLYSNTESVSVHYRRTALITSITLPRGVKPDALDRLVLLPLTRIEGERLSEGDLNAAWEAARPLVLAGVLDLAVRMLAGLPTAENPAGLRMADYAQALWAMDPALYDAYRDNVATARGDMADEDPFIRALLAWLRSCPDKTWEGTPDEAQQEGAVYADFEDAWWPRNGRALSEQLTKASELLHAVGVTVTDRRSNGQRLKKLVLVDR